MYLFHGTSLENALKICENGFGEHELIWDKGLSKSDRMYFHVQAENEEIKYKTAEEFSAFYRTYKAAIYAMALAGHENTFHHKINSRSGIVIFVFKLNEDKRNVLEPTIGAFDLVEDVSIKNSLLNEGFRDGWFSCENILFSESYYPPFRWHYLYLMKRTFLNVPQKMREAKEYVKVVNGFHKYGYGMLEDLLIVFPFMQTEWIKLEKMKNYFLRLSIRENK